MTKKKEARRYNTKVRPKKIEEDNMVLKQVVKTSYIPIGKDPTEYVKNYLVEHTNMKTWMARRF